jgi:hypothetical protein
LCPPGFTSDRCETNIDECSSCHPNNTVSCIDGINTYSCVCVQGYTGEDCEGIVDMCDMNPCVNGGTCVSLFNDFTCNCLDGFTGPVCNIDTLDDCHPALCLFGGTCVDLVSNQLTHTSRGDMTLAKRSKEGGGHLALS